ncbi:MarR family transcriptional regulator [Allopusillimonas ginsengisoli]|nr:MarR family transcriptional regulator [Allopusillimonas ginsengisoli]
MTLQLLTESPSAQRGRYQTVPTAQSADHMLDEMAMVVSRRLSVYTEALLSAQADAVQMSQQDLRALAFIIEFESLSTGHLGQLMGLSHGGATSLINRLESAGFIQRDRCERDRRVVMLRPVAERCEPLMRPEPYVVNHITELAQRSSASELTGMCDFLTRCVKVLRQDTLQWLATRELVK